MCRMDEVLSYIPKALKTALRVGSWCCLAEGPNKQSQRWFFQPHRVEDGGNEGRSIPSFEDPDEQMCDICSC